VRGFNKSTAVADIPGNSLLPDGALKQNDYAASPFFARAPSAVADGRYRPPVPRSLLPVFLLLASNTVQQTVSTLVGFTN